MSLLDGLKFFINPAFLIEKAFTLWGGGSGGGGSTTVQQVTIPKELIPYVRESIQGAQKVAALPYVAYSGQRIAGLTPQQQQAMAGIMSLQSPEDLAAASAAARGTGSLGFNVAQQGLSKALGFTPGQFTADTVGSTYTPQQFYAQQAISPTLRQYQMSPAERAMAATFTGQAAEQYMSPYQKQVTDIAAREAQRQAAITQRQADLNATTQGTYGGARQALLQAERERNLGQQVSDLYARGQQSAYENAQQQFERDQARRAGAQQANIQAALTSGQANLQALLGTQQLGAQQNLQAQLANQAAGLEAQRARAQAMQFGAAQNLQAALANQQARLEAQRAAEQSRQYGAGIGAQVGQAGLGTSMQAAQTLGQLGQAQQEAALQRLAAQQQVGAQVQAQNQALLSQRYQDFLEQRGYPKEQASFYSNIVRGLPISPASTQTTTAPAPSMLSQLGGLGVAGLGLYNLLPK